MSWLYCSGCPAPALLSCSDHHLIPFIMFRLFCPLRLFWLSGPCCPALEVLGSCPVLVVLAWLSCPVCPVLAVLSWLSCPGCPVLTVLSWLSCPGCPVLAVLSWLSCPGCPVLAIRSWCQVSTALSLSDIRQCLLISLTIMRLSVLHLEFLKQSTDGAAFKAYR
jgi:hypothetical protein